MVPNIPWRVKLLSVENCLNHIQKGIWFYVNVIPTLGIYLYYFDSHEGFWFFANSDERIMYKLVRITWPLGLVLKTFYGRRD
jgi:hypothetical protein